MNRFTASLAGVVGLSVFASVASAGGGIPFSYTGSGGAIPDANFATYSVDLPVDVEEVLSLEVDINNLSHPHPDDLKIFLIHPFAGVITLLEDQGDGLDVNGVNLTFSDAAASPAPDEGQILSQTYRPLGLAEGSDGGLGTFLNLSGAGTWNLLVIDDSRGDVGRFDSFTLRGTFVPEPVTLSLLAIGAAAALRRKRASSDRA